MFITRMSLPPAPPNPAPLLSRAASNPALTDWAPNPDTRGTASILYTCVAAVLLCSYNSLHSLIPPVHLPAHTTAPGAR
ncbi:uncharacterized protein BROUX77_002483 [Berkeleyomyces rouxiae]|uniref:uncharacterized protein n=1 Tax=Berkeleyomyces rouxiae TaxID=2035830 RepID=UPI003B7920A5